MVDNSIANRAKYRASQFQLAVQFDLRYHSVKLNGYQVKIKIGDGERKEDLETSLGTNAATRPKTAATRQTMAATRPRTSIRRGTAAQGHSAGKNTRSLTTQNGWIGNSGFQESRFLSLTWRAQPLQRIQASACLTASTSAPVPTGTSAIQGLPALPMGT